MKCRICQRSMTGAGFLAYIEAYLIRTVVQSLIKLLVDALRFYLAPGTRGFWDEQMAELANACGIECPKCKSTQCWDPAPEKLRERMEAEL